jgi:site-specific recombinase XerD
MRSAAVILEPARAQATDPDELSAVDQLALSALRASLAEARRSGDGRPALAIVGAALGALGVHIPTAAPGCDAVMRYRDGWLRRVAGAGRSKSTLDAYRIAIDGYLDWAGRADRMDRLLEESTIVDHLDDYRRRQSPAPATYHRRFILLRRFLRWVAQSESVGDPFAELDAPARPRQESDWLTIDEFRRMLDAAGRPLRARRGLAERDRLVLIALLTTGLRRAELLGLDWRDVDFDARHPSLLVRGKGNRPRRHPLAASLARELAELQRLREPRADDPVFCGLQGRRLQATVLADIIRRAAGRAGIDKKVTAHTLRHSAATWLRQDTGDARLVAEYLGHADLSTVSRYAHVAAPELQTAADSLAAHAGLATPVGNLRDHQLSFGS